MRETRDSLIRDFVRHLKGADRAVQMEPAVQASLIAGQRSREAGHGLVLTHQGCEPLLDLRLRAGEGVGAVLATGLLLDGLRLRAETAQVDH